MHRSWGIVIDTIIPNTDHSPAADRSKHRQVAEYSREGLDELDPGQIAPVVLRPWLGRGMDQEIQKFLICWRKWWSEGRLFEEDLREELKDRLTVANNHSGLWKSNKNWFSGSHWTN